MASTTLRLTSIIFFSAIALGSTYHSLPANHYSIPRIKSGYTGQPIVYSVGSTVLIDCPVDSAGSTFYEWSKDGEDLYPYYGRFRAFENGTLKIRPVKLKDKGTYTCQVAGGSGPIDVDVSLQVVDGTSTEPNNVANPVPSQAKEDSGPENPIQVISSVLGGAKPRFGSRPQKKPFFNADNAPEETIINKLVGQSVTFVCSAKGRPKPKVSWFFGDEPLDMSSLPSGSRLLNSTLILSNLRLKDHGMYFCIASNKLGSVNASFDLRIADEEIAPDEIRVTVVNSTVTVGDKATFVCKVLSRRAPLIHWLKKTPKNEITDEYSTHFIDNSGQYFKSIQSSDSTLVEDNVNQNTLTLLNVQMSDAGHYLCLVATTHNYETTAAFLNVLPKETSSNDESNEIVASWPTYHQQSPPVRPSVRIFPERVPQPVLWMAAAAILFITFVVLFVLLYRGKQEPTSSGKIAPNQCRNGSCPNALIAESVVSQAMKSTRTSYDQDMFSRWIDEQSALMHSITGTASVSMAASEIAIRTTEARLQAYGKAASDVTAYSLPSRFCQSSTNTAATATSQSDFKGRTARPNTPATPGSDVTSIDASITNL